MMVDMRVTLRLERDDAAVLDRLAAERNTTRSALLRTLIRAAAGLADNTAAARLPNGQRRARRRRPRAEHSNPAQPADTESDRQSGRRA